MELNDPFSLSIQESIPINPKKRKKREGDEGAKNSCPLFWRKMIDFVN